MKKDTENNKEQVKDQKLKNSSFIEAWENAFNGIIYAVTTQGNIKKQLIIAVVVMILSLFFNLNRAEFLCLMFTVILIIIGFLVGFKISDRYRFEKSREGMTIFDLKTSNMKFINNINNVIASNVSVIEFERDSPDPYLPVDKESKSLVCIANGTNHLIKVQFSSLKNILNLTVKTLLCRMKKTQKKL